MLLEGTPFVIACSHEMRPTVLLTTVVDCIGMGIYFLLCEFCIINCCCSVVGLVKTSIILYIASVCVCVSVLALLVEVERNSKMIDDWNKASFHNRMIEHITTQHLRRIADSQLQFQLT